MPHPPRQLHSIPSASVNEKLPCLTQREVIFPVHVRLKLYLTSFPQDTVHAPVFSGQDSGVMQLNTMTQAYPMFHHN
jgi:hypothetical protein